jgi:hypothetical protein
MLADKTIEERLAALEAAVQELQNLVRKPAPARNWWEQTFGSISDIQAFEEAMEYGRAFRYADRLPDEPGEQK